MGWPRQERGSPHRAAGRHARTVRSSVSTAASSSWPAVTSSAARPSRTEHVPEHQRAHGRRVDRRLVLVVVRRQAQDGGGVPDDQRRVGSREGRVRVGRWRGHGRREDKRVEALLAQPVP